MRTAYTIIYILVCYVWRLFFRIKVTGRQNIPDGPFLCCGNHTSMADPVFMAIALTIKRHIYFMAKIELMRIPVIGYLFKLAGAYSVDRGNSDVSAIKNTLSLLKKDRIIGIFPEGRRVREGESESAKNGVAMLAVRAGAPMLPMYISPYKLFGRVNVVIGEPYYPELEGKRPTTEDYSKISAELLNRIMILGRANN